MNISKRHIDSEGGRIHYLLTYANNFNVVRLSTDLQRSAADFAHFITASVNESCVIVTANKRLISDIDVPAFMLRSADEKIQFLSFRCLISYWAQFYIDAKYGFAKRSAFIKSEQLVREFEGWEARGLVQFALPGDFEALEHPKVLAVGDLGYLSEVAMQHSSLVSASGYSIIDDDECTSPFQSVRDPIGFRAESGIISSLPLYGRPCMIQSSAGFEMKYLNVDDFTISLPDGTAVRSHQRGWGGALEIVTPDGKRSTTPLDPDRVELVIVERHVVAVCYGGGIPIPRAGFILSGKRQEIDSNIISALLADNSLSYQLREVSGLRSGIQCGPTLLHNGEKAKLVGILREEAFLSTDIYARIAPASLQNSIGNIKAARSMLGIDAAGRLAVVVVEGTATGVARGNDGLGTKQAFGASFSDLANIALQEGMRDAMALDSGGSVGLFHNGASFIASGDFRRTPTTRFERPLAHAILYS